MNIVSPGSPWWTMTEPRAAEAGARRRERAWRMLSGSVKKMATRSRIWNRLRSSSGEPRVGWSLSLTPQRIIGRGSRIPATPPHTWGGVAEGDGGAGLNLNSLVDLAAAGPVV